MPFCPNTDDNFPNEYNETRYRVLSIPQIRNAQDCIEKIQHSTAILSMLMNIGQSGVNAEHHLMQNRIGSLLAHEDLYHLGSQNETGTGTASRDKLPVMNHGLL